MIDPNSGAAEPCATCASLASKGAGTMGIVLLIAGIAAVIGLVYFVSGSFFGNDAEDLSVFLRRLRRKPSRGTPLADYESAHGNAISSDR